MEEYIITESLYIKDIDHNEEKVYGSLEFQKEETETKSKETIHWNW